MRIELPSTKADRAPLLSGAVVFVIALAVGLAIARGAVGARPPASEDEGWPADAEAEAEAEAEPAAAEAEAEAAAATDPVAAAAAAATAVAVAVAPAPAMDSVAAPLPASEPSRGPARGTLVRGRVAYLRCEGGRSGGECNRDHAIEDALWNHIETLSTCASGPTPGGQADLVVTLADEGASLRARDTFAADVIRLDAPAAVGCLEGAIAADPVLTGSARRIVLSFRFSL